MKPQVFIRTDASPEIGLGHLIRCSALAQMLYEIYDVVFFCKAIPDSSAAEINGIGITIIKINHETEFFQALKPGFIVVLDGYDFNLSYQSQIKERGCHLVFIDDFFQQDLIADLVINHAPLIGREKYHVSPATKFALGLDYALLRPVFLKLAQEESKVTEKNEVFVCFGGADYKNLTRTTLNILSKYPAFKKINVVTGPAYLYKDELSMLISGDFRILHHHAVNAAGICSLISRCSIAVVPASGILYEVIAAGCRIVSGYYTDNQLGIYEGFRALNGFADAIDFNEHALTRALDEIESFIPVRLIDGNSPSRIVDKINALHHVDSNFS
jgi:UDP-2,4-diacetamido-2,4,6-trideoxy-beta-L-altropyranose hydrolase